MSNIEEAIALTRQTARTEALLEAEKAIRDLAKDALDMKSVGTAGVLSLAADQIKKLA